MPDLNKLVNIERLQSFGEGTIVPLRGMIVNLCEAISALDDNQELGEEIFAERYGTSASYKVDEYCIYNHNLYKCVEACTVTWTDAYIVGETAKASDWLSLTSGGSAIPQQKGVVDARVFKVQSPGSFLGKFFIWNPTDGVYVQSSPAFDQSKWTAVTLTEEMQESGGGGTTIVPIPTVSGSTTYTYDGTEKSLPLSGFDASKMTIVNGSATDAGEYTAVVSLKNTSRMVWTDLTTQDKTFTWEITKAAGAVSLSKTSVALNADKRSDTITATVTGDGVLSAESSDPNTAAVSLSGNVATVQSVNDTTGTATVTFSVPETTNYTAASATATISCTFTTIYGVLWDGTSTTAWSRTDASAGFVDPVPAVNNGTGSSPFDDCMPWSGMERVVDSEAGTLVKIPKFYYKWTRSGSTMKLQIADGPVDGFLVSPAHADRGDGKGERDYVYVGAYHCSTNDYKSTTGVKPKGNVTRASFRTSIHNLGSDIWQWDYAMLWTIQMLYLVEFADWNSQAKIGYGCGNNSGTDNAGLCDAMTYHTGTNKSNRTTYGHTRYRWIEDLWGNVLDWCDGIYFSSANIYCIKNPANFSDSSGGTKVGTRPTTDGYISSWTTPTAEGFEYALYPSAVAGGENTYVSDYCNYYSSGVVLCVGGGYGQDQGFGLFCLGGSGAASYSYGNVGSRLQKLP